MLHARRGIGADGVRALAAALQHVRGLKELYVGGNSIGSVTLAALRTAAAAAVGPGLGVIV